jgi:uncharacterized protein (DUF305 family)
MKSIFLLAGLGSILIACNTNNKTDKHGSSNHATHNETHTVSKTENKMNPVIATMDKMMHEMHRTKPIGNNDVDFAAMMLEHHVGAVEMSKVEVDKGNDTELKAFAQKVIDDQKKEIEFMREFMSKASKTSSSNSADFQRALNGSMMAMMYANTTTYNDIDSDFAAQMIPHHQSAVDMAKVYLEFGQDTSLRTLCENIVRSQTAEINWLKEWSAANGK